MGGAGGAGFPNNKFEIDLLFSKSMASTFSQLRPVEAGHSRKKKISSFGHSAKADVTFFTGMEMETPPLCQEARTHEASQHRGLDDNLRVLDVLFALDHPQLQLRRAGLPSSPSLGFCTLDGPL